MTGQTLFGWVNLRLKCPDLDKYILVLVQLFTATTKVVITIQESVNLNQKEVFGSKKLNVKSESILSMLCKLYLNKNLYNTYILHYICTYNLFIWTSHFI